MSGVKVVFIHLPVRPFIRFQQGEIEHPGLVCAQVLHCLEIGKYVHASFFTLGLVRLLLHAVDHLLRVRCIFPVNSIKSGYYRKAALFFAQDTPVRLPGTKCGYASPIARLMVNELEYVKIRIIGIMIGIDSAVCEAGKELIISRVREGVRVGYIYKVLVLPVAIQLAFTHKLAPDERE